MADDMNQRGAQDRARVSLGENWEVDYWTNRFNCSEEELKQAVDQVGNSADAVEEYFNQQGKN